MLYKFLQIISLIFLISCNFDDKSLTVSDINQDELYYQNFVLNSNLSRTIQNYPSNGQSSLLYSGQIDSANYSYSIIDFDNSVFQNYDLCNQDSLSYKKVHLVIDLINEYKIANEDNNNDNMNSEFNDDTPPILAYWVHHDVLGLDFDANWSESDLNITSNFELDDIDNYGQKLFLDNHQGKYYLDITNQLIPSLPDADNICNEQSNEYDCSASHPCAWINEACEELNFCEQILDSDDDGTVENECVDSDGCIWAKESCSILNSLDICDLNNENSYYLLIKTPPNSNLLYEFASSEYTSDYSNTEPYLNIIYDEYKELTKKSNKFTISNLSNYIASSLYIADTLVNDYNYIFVADSISAMEETNQINTLILWSDYNINSPLDINLNENQELLQINIDLVNTDNFNDSNISFWLDSIRYFKYIEDPNNDNYPNGTENNLLFDISDSDSYPGEFIHDSGIDGCYDEYEDGLNGCDTLSTIYNDLGTENNYHYDIGEYYDDIGSDGCPDEYEDGTWDENTGIGICVCEFPDNCTIDDVVENVNDANQDNYNIDPSEDDWFDINNNDEWDEGEKLEGNNQHDSMCSDGSLDDQTDCETGGSQWIQEPFYDVGLDGLDSILVDGIADEGENNNKYDIGEIFFDTGIDSLFTKCPDSKPHCTNIEFGYNLIGNENDGFYQLGEPFEDCGEDGVCNDGDSSDDYNVDPNLDNWSDCGMDGICPNNENYIDSDDGELNGLWDEGEGTEFNNQLDANETYDDYGIDGISNIEEISGLLDLNQKISISRTDTTYYNYNNGTVNYPDLISQENDSLKVWISSVETQGGNNVNIVISILAQHDIFGLEFQLNHDIYTTQVMDWDNKERNVAKVDYESYIKDFSLFNNGPWNQPNSLSLNYAFGYSSLLNFEGLDLFINDNRNIIINENNSFLTIFLDKDNDSFLLESDSYMISFDEPWENFPNQHESEDSDIVTLFLYNVNNNPDSLRIPIGNLVQNYINNQSVYSGENSCIIDDVDNPGCDDGIWLNLKTNQNANYPFNFNNIVLDKDKPPILDIYYFK